MSRPYFRQVPNFDYISRDADRRNISDYVAVKNLFKRGKIREEIAENLTFFDKYKIIGDERPDNVAYNVYQDSTLDWVVLLSNNILNIQTEWPLAQDTFFNFLERKYGTLDKAYAVHHYETREVRSSNGSLILPKGLVVPQDYSFSFFDAEIGIDVVVSNVTDPVTNFEIENKDQDAKRNIFVLKPTYSNVIFTDIEEIMIYKEGSEQYLSETFKKADNIRLFG
jgi:hypothetical protein